MKRFIVALAIALMGFNSSALAVEEPPVDPLLVGIHAGMGLGGYWDYPSEYLGNNDWMVVAFDVGCAFNIRVNRYLRVVPELNLGVGIASRDAGSVSYYDVSENRGAYGLNIPVAVRFTPHRQFYLEAGAGLNLNFASSHSFSGSDINGNTISVSKSGGMFSWKAETFVPSLIFGLGGSFRADSYHDIDVGARFIFDVGGIEKYDDIYFTIDDQLGSVKNKTKVWCIQLVVNYYFGTRL